MRLDRLRAIRSKFHGVIRVITWVAAGALSIMVLIIVVNVIGRYLFSKPFMGTVEIIQIMLVITVFFALAHTEVRKAHITFSEVVNRFPRRAQAIVMSIMYFAAAAYFIIIAWREVVLAVAYLLPTVSGTDVLEIPVAPFMIIISIGSMMLGIEMLLNGFLPMSSEDGGKEEVK